MPATRSASSPVAAASSWTTTSTAAAAPGSRTTGRIATQLRLRDPEGRLHVLAQLGRGPGPLAVGRGDQPGPGGLQLAQPLLLLLPQPQVGHGQPDGAGDGRGRRAVLQHGRAMGHDRDRPTGAVHGQPPPIPPAGHPLPAPIHERRVRSMPPVDPELRVAEHVAEHGRQPVQPGQLSLRQERVGQPRPPPEHGRCGEREAGRDQQQHQLVAEQDHSGVERAGAKMLDPPHPGQDRRDRCCRGGRVPGGSGVGAPPGQHHGGDPGEQRGHTKLRQQPQRDQPGQAHQHPGDDPADPTGREGDQRHHQDGLVQRPGADQERTRQPRRTHRGHQGPFTERPPGRHARGHKGKPHGNVHGGQPRARRRRLAVGPHRKHDQYPDGEDTARPHRQGVR